MAYYYFQDRFVKLQEEVIITKKALEEFRTEPSVLGKSVVKSNKQMIISAKLLKNGGGDITKFKKVLGCYERSFQS